MKRILLLDSRISLEILENIKKINENIILVPQNPSLDNAVSAHPDMNYLQIDKKVFSFRSTNVRGMEAIQISTTKAGKIQYPDDVKLNAVCIGKDFICRKKSVDSDVLRYAVELGMNVIDVNQGYAKCNISVVSEKDKAVITEDEGIAETLKKYDYNVLLLKKHEVKLFPYEYGFIGGASGKIGDTLYFTGDVSKHSEFGKIKEFCDKFGVNIESLSCEALYDYGSIIEIVTE